MENIVPASQIASLQGRIQKLSEGGQLTKGGAYKRN